MTTRWFTSSVRKISVAEAQMSLLQNIPRGGKSEVMHTLQAMHTLAISETQGCWRKFFVTCVHEIYSFLFLGTLSHSSMCVFIISAINNNNYYSLKWRWLVVVIYRILSTSSCISGTACLIIREMSLFVTAAINNYWMRQSMIWRWAQRQWITSEISIILFLTSLESWIQ